jgi:uncharacterized membrane protein (UPF0182 family)
MTLATTLLRNKWAISLMAALALSLAIAPVAQGQQATDFGVNQFEDELQLGNQNLQVTIARIINVALSLLGIVAVVIILIGGFQWMTAGGNDEKVAGARKLIFSGIIGLAIILSAFAIARFVLSSLSTATGTGALPGEPA